MNCLPGKHADGQETETPDYDVEQDHPAARHLIVLLQIPAVIKTRHLVAITVEHQCGALTKFANAPFRRLAPARMVNVGIYVRVKTVLAGRCLVPCSRRLIVHKFNFDNRLDALEAVFPGNDDADRGSVLIWEDLAIQSKGE